MGNYHYVVLLKYTNLKYTLCTPLLVSEYYKLVTVKIPMELDQQVKEIMKAVGKVTMSEVVREALYEWVEKRRHLITSTAAATERETR